MSLVPNSQKKETEAKNVQVSCPRLDYSRAEPWAVTLRKHIIGDSLIKDFVVISRFFIVFKTDLWVFDGTVPGQAAWTQLILNNVYIFLSFTHQIRSTGCDFIDYLEITIAVANQT